MLTIQRGYWYGIQVRITGVNVRFKYFKVRIVKSYLSHFCRGEAGMGGSKRFINII